MTLRHICDAATADARGLVAVPPERADALLLSEWDLAAALEFAGIPWSVCVSPAHEDLAVSHFVRAPAWMDTALKALRKHPEFRTGGEARADVMRAAYFAARRLSALREADAALPGLLPALEQVRASVPIGQRGEAMAQLLIVRGVWGPLSVRRERVAERCLTDIGLDITAWRKTLEGKATDAALEIHDTPRRRR